MLCTIGQESKWTTAPATGAVAWPQRGAAVSLRALGSRVPLVTLSFSLTLALSLVTLDKLSSAPYGCSTAGGRDARDRA